MGEKSRKLDMEELMNYSNNLIEVLKEEKDAIGLDHFLRHTEASQSQWAKHHNEVASSIEVIINGVDDLDHRRVYIEEEFQKNKKFDQNELRAQMKLSMYASVTNTIPYLDDESKLSGHIVVRDKRAVDKFELDPSKDNCNTIWKMINL